MDPKMQKLERGLELTLGGLGALLVGWFAWRYHRSLPVHSPLALAYLALMAGAFYPSLGLGMAVQGKPLGVFGKLWIVSAIFALLVLVPLAFWLW